MEKKREEKEEAFLLGKSRTSVTPHICTEEPLLVERFCDVGSGLCSRDVTFAPSCFIISLELRKTVDLESTVTLLSKYSTLSWSVTVSDTNRKEVKS